MRFNLLAVGLFLAASVLACTTLAAPPDPDLRGAWRTETYTMKDGTERSVEGLITFTTRDWTTLFFVRDGDTLRRGSGEGGTYTLDGTRLVFTHLYHLSAGEALANVPESAPVKMQVNPPDQAPIEPCTVEIDGEHLTIAFPSGNRMTFRRNSGF